jgi:hypothetical protein
MRPQMLVSDDRTRDLVSRCWHLLTALRPFLRPGRIAVVEERVNVGRP